VLKHPGLAMIYRKILEQHKDEITALDNNDKKLILLNKISLELLTVIKDTQSMRTIGDMYGKNK